MAVVSPGVHTLEASNPQRIDWQRGDRIEYKDRAKMPLAAYLDESGTNKSSQSDLIRLFTGDLINRRHAYASGTIGNTAGDSGDLTIATHANEIVVGALLSVHSGASSSSVTNNVLVQVTSISSTVFTCTNLSGGTVASTGFVNPIAFASADDATAGPTYVDIEPTNVLGYLSLLKMKIEISITERDTKVYAATSREQEKIERSRMDFMRAREASMWMSRATSNVGTNKIRTSMGLYQQIVNGGNTSVDAGGNTLADADLGSAISAGAKYFENTKFGVFHGEKALNGLFQLGSGKVLTDESDEMYGYTAQMIGVAQYRMNMIHSQLFDVMGAPFTDVMIGVDMNSIEKWYLAGEGQMQLKKDTDPKASKEGEVVSHMWRVQEGVTAVVRERHFSIHNLG